MASSTFAVRIEREGGPVRSAYLPVETEPTVYGTHGPIAEHYGHEPGQYLEHASTLDTSSAPRAVD